MTEAPWKDLMSNDPAKPYALCKQLSSIQAMQNI